MADEKETDTTEPVDELQALEDIESRLADVQTRLATLLQQLADGKSIGGALVGYPGPWTAERRQEFEAIVKSHDKTTGSLWEALSEAGYEVIELPEAVYGALSPETR
ncbi:hypothetical protein LCGC14_0259080 [marine sediment metagenome]|uniref:Uncharacterized protein n=1 Tax=marine sediment metagenome TaxID=412755 RepID=A0A0F9X7A2_9ZZZZ